ncbi:MULTISPECIES: PIN domain-containing protein [Rickettsieae]|uniref:PIN domain-containing protein n=1 Tax=Rickettsieae TaxID=33988 RepID=UPI000B9C2F72|nr:PIN domain-containing protein [Rickettsia endosymbiont of Culicoides newsteadi]OZG31642.1 toxin of toxin-antitoxin system [Rickettsia endosymbiont of Culicoides newsteadi]HJD56601.1 PIN domain-containing protein [Rickettsia endosymbiont of Sericostoma sp. HW-2014]
MKYLLDTCTISFFLRGQVNVIEQMQQVSPSDLSISVVTLLEIEYGFNIKQSQQMNKLYKKWQSLVSLISILPFNDGTAIIAAAIRALLKQQGKSIGAYDVLIAATALEHKIICVTNNLSEFQRIKELELLDWTVGT